MNFTSHGIHFEVISHHQNLHTTIWSPLLRQCIRLKERLMFCYILILFKLGSLKRDSQCFHFLTCNKSLEIFSLKEKIFTMQLQYPGVSLVLVYNHISAMKTFLPTAWFFSPGHIVYLACPVTLIVNHVDVQNFSNYSNLSHILYIHKAFPMYLVCKRKTKPSQCF